MINITSDLDKELKNELLQQFYEYFETGYDFENFLKYYLSFIGLEEVVVTQRSRDGGVDLNATRKGIGDFSDIDITHYRIQAKRYNIKKTVGDRYIAELQGRLNAGEKGIFITTSKFSKPAIKQANCKPEAPVVLIDGEMLINSCIEKQIGFVYKPIFSKRELDSFVHKNDESNSNYTEVIENTTEFVEKEITANDIRARIISIPSYIYNKFPDDVKTCTIVINDSKEYRVTVNRDRKYLGSVTSLLREFALLSDDGVIYPKKARWIYSLDKNKIQLILL